ncbi:hypothetical protein FDENT_6743 [Fusarium denticulatum]|uniref:DUF7918 domain-containing protein n=1 Tax=Fusarium denticulatum TaxID=48507 RepID=A0A8H5X862_9HYPO|nr:hypothetical protein FDENT_6743 [Fusarium denticulatum]
MAVLPGVPGIDVRIVVNGLPTEEWPFEENKKREVGKEDVKTNEHKLGHVRSEGPQLPTSSNYIQSKSGCQFWVRATLSNDFESSNLPAGADGITFQIYIDGVVFGTGSIPLGTRMTRNWDCAFVKSDHGTMKLRYPVFSDIVSVEDTDNDKIRADMARVKEMGTIHIWVSAVKMNQPSILAAKARDRPDMEMAYKATILHGEGLTHGTTYKDEDIEDSNSQRAAYLTSLLGRLGNFIFRYSANPPRKGKKGEPESCIPAKRKYEEVKMLDGRSVLNLTGDDD